MVNHLERSMVVVGYSKIKNDLYFQMTLASSAVMWHASAHGDLAHVKIRQPISSIIREMWSLHIQSAVFQEDIPWTT